MRVKYTAIPKVVNGDPAVPWAGPSVAERPKQVEPSKKDKKKTERALDWLRRNR